MNAFSLAARSMSRRSRSAAVHAVVFLLIELRLVADLMVLNDALFVGDGSTGEEIELGSATVASRP